MNNHIMNMIDLKHSETQDCHIIYKDNIVHIYLTLLPKEESCPYCGQSRTIKKGFYKKKLIHSAYNFSKCILHYNARKYKCALCGKMFYESNSFCTIDSHLTNMTVIQILKDLKRINYTFTSVAEKNHVSISTVMRIFDNYVDIPNGKLSEVLSIDEFYLGRSWKYKFACVFFDPIRREIIDIFPSRRKEQLFMFAQYIPKKELNNVKYVIMDMYPTYKSLVKKYFPNAIICVDSFHVMKNINDSLKHVRINTMKNYDSSSLEYYLLKKFSWLLMKNSEDIEDNQPKFNHKLNQTLNYKGILNLILEIDPNLKLSYIIKEKYHTFNMMTSIDKAADEFDLILQIIIASEIKEFKSVITLLENWREEILNSFILYNKKRISNGPIESLNGKIKVILRNALGYKNFVRLRNRIMFCMNKNSPIKIHKGLHINNINNNHR